MEDELEQMKALATTSLEKLDDNFDADDFYVDRVALKTKSGDDERKRAISVCTNLAHIRLVLAQSPELPYKIVLDYFLQLD